MSAPFSFFRNHLTWASEHDFSASSSAQSGTAYYDADYPAISAAGPQPDIYLWLFCGLVLSTYVLALHAYLLAFRPTSVQAVVKHTRLHRFLAAPTPHQKKALPCRICLEGSKLCLPCLIHHIFAFGWSPAELTLVAGGVPDQPDAMQQKYPRPPRWYDVAKEVCIVFG